MPKADVPYSLCLRQPGQVGDRNSCNAIDRVDSVEFQGIDDKMKSVGQGGRLSFARCIHRLCCVYYSRNHLECLSSSFQLPSFLAELLGVILISAVVAPSIYGEFGELLAQALLFGKASRLVTNYGHDSGHMS